MGMRRSLHTTTAKLSEIIQSLTPAPAADEMEVDRPAPQPCEVIPHPGGITSVGFELHQQHADFRIATLLAANSGRPGGAIRAADGTAEQSKVHGGHSTQEEDVVSNWLLTSAQDWPERQRLFAQISGQWGLHEPHGTDARTLQGMQARMEEQQKQQAIQGKTLEALCSRLLGGGDTTAAAPVAAPAAAFKI